MDTHVLENLQLVINAQMESSMGMKLVMMEIKIHLMVVIRSAKLRIPGNVMMNLLCARSVKMGSCKVKRLVMKEKS